MIQAGVGPTSPALLCRVGESPLAKVSLHPPLEGYLQPGAALSGTVDLRQSHDATELQPGAPKCVAVAITLEMEERVEETWRQNRRPATDTIRKVGTRLAGRSPALLATV